MEFLRPYAPQLLSILRIMAGLLVLQYGTTKYLSIPVGPMNNASPMTMSGAAGLIELVFGALLVIGLFTRLSAFILSGMCAVAYSTPMPDAISFRSSTPENWLHSTRSCSFTLRLPAAVPGAPIGHGMRTDPNTRD